MKAVLLSLLVMPSVWNDPAKGAVGVDVRPSHGVARVTLIQMGEAERSWESIKDTTSVAVLQTFIARYKGTKFAELARARLEQIKPKEAAPPLSSLRANATAEEMIAELPINADMLRLADTDSD